MKRFVIPVEIDIIDKWNNMVYNHLLVSSMLLVSRIVFAFLGKLGPLNYGYCFSAEMGR
ncbi:MAG: hypothetical protein ABID54_09380 [Pseudomonadota bacterium]